MRNLLVAAAMALSLAACATPGASAPVAAAPAATQADFERDRQSILAMAGNYRVMFDFKETVPFVADYKPIEPKESGGFEIVRVVEDTGTKIALQHILVMEMDNKQTFIIKHWRHDWTYQPKTVLTYAGPGKWVLTDVPAATAAGAWSQTVWQTDDSPRYGGVGHWRYDGGDVRWMSDETLRPLARRDAVRKPPYDHYRGTNRHALTPKGWVHEQDNAKLGLRNGVPTTIVHEVVLNTYRRDEDFPSAKGDAYWAKTKDYWAAVRGMWDQAIAAGKGVTVKEEPENGSDSGPALMGLADDIVSGTETTAGAILKARAEITRVTGVALTP
ncbi:hypothetical protein sos41_13270 [Alphaproteobacteria bacterium SO-S41]|nr:hypothetical protein sos41_13270 [Alphaproteobacteria bacterium SO-S41]